MTLWIQPDPDGSGMASASIGRPTSGGMLLTEAEVLEREDGKAGCIVRTPEGEWVVRALPASMARKHLTVRAEEG